MTIDVLDDTGWMFDLVSLDPIRRDAAVARHVQTKADLASALEVANALWWEARRNPGGPDPVLDSPTRPEWRAFHAATLRTAHGVVGAFDQAHRAGDRPGQQRLAPHAVLFLQWEARFPEHWRSAGPWSPWHLKKRVLRRFADAGVPQAHVDALTRLTLAAVNRGQRCEDRGYVLLARTLDNPALRAGIAAAAYSSDQTVKLRADYMRWALDHPALPATPANWRAWSRARSTQPA